MINISLYLKYLKYSVFKKKFIMKSYCYHLPDNFNGFLQSPNVPYIVKSKDEKEMYANFYKYRSTIFDSKEYKKRIEYRYVIKWVVIGYVNNKTIYECNWNEFKSVYGNLFFPYLRSSESIASDEVMNKLANQIHERTNSFKKLF